MLYVSVTVAFWSGRALTFYVRLFDRAGNSQTCVYNSKSLNRLFIVVSHPHVWGLVDTTGYTLSYLIKLINTYLWGPSSGQVRCYYAQHFVLTHVRLFDRARRLPL